MPLYDPSGRPFTPGQMVGAKRLADYPALSEAEFKEVCRQIDEGLSAGVSEHVPVTIATGILVRILQTVNVGFSDEKAAPLAPPPEADAYLTPIPDVAALRARVAEEDKAKTE